jgi:hypothetical protein
MVGTLQVISLVLVAIAAALPLAHALELPGKLRLEKGTYLAVQKIYYPGFTIGGMAEPAAMVSLLGLLVLGPSSGPGFWWTLAALGSLVGAHAVYWFVTHPTNGFWTRNIQLTGLAAAFFSVLSRSVGDDWERLRDVWEYSHVARSVLAMLSLVFMTLAVTT